MRNTTMCFFTTQIDYFNNYKIYCKKKIRRLYDRQELDPIQLLCLRINVAWRESENESVEYRFP